MKYNEKHESNFFGIAGNYYYFDLDELSQFIRIEKPENTSDSIVDDILGENKKEKKEDDPLTEEEIPMDGQIIDLTKWETIKVMIESVLSENGTVDEAMGRTKLGEQLSIPFRLSFNTLVNYKIIKEQ
jgi:hypothetical protein